jgi:hypothetical protein
LHDEKKIAAGTAAGGREATLFIVTSAVVIFIYAKLHNKFGMGEYDERNFKRAREGTYGTAAWMSDKETKKVLEVTTPDKALGAMPGEKNGKVVCPPVDTKLNSHIFVCGASGAGKSKAIARNMLFQCIKRGESVIPSDQESSTEFLSSNSCCQGVLSNSRYYSRSVEKRVTKQTAIILQSVL